MGRLPLLLLILALPLAVAAQGTGVLRVSVSLMNAPVARHALLISDNPATSAPRRVFTKPDGTLELTLRPGSYTVESDAPFAYRGMAYQWTQMVDVQAGRDTQLVLTAENAETVPLSDVPAAPGRATRDSAVDLSTFHEGMVAIWSPTARVSGFLVDARGLIVTTRAGVGSATTVEVQLSPTLKVPGRVLAPGASRDAAVVWVDPAVLTDRPAIPLTCPPPAALALDERQDIVAISAALRTGVDQESGEVTGLQPRGVETDLRLAFGGAGGPVFNAAGALVGMTSLPQDAESRKRTDVTVVRVGLLCEAMTAARSRLAEATPPEATRLPLEPSRAYPEDALAAAGRTPTTAIDPPVVSSEDFEVALITPPMMARAEQRADWTGGRTGRSPETEARIGRLTEFGEWAEYFIDRPAVLVIRVTPKMVEGFWKRLGREAARTQGAVLPAFKDFKTRFLRMGGRCGSADVPPIHPFVLEHRLSETDVIREGLYVFDAAAFGPHCGTVTLSLYSEKEPDKADTLVVDPKAIDRIWQDFAAWRAP